MQKTNTTIEDILPLHQARIHERDRNPYCLDLVSRSYAFWSRSRSGSATESIGTDLILQT